jgi:outer membrane protein assembly factor BamB
VQYQFNPRQPGEALLGADADGYSNRQEMLAGTNPLIAASVPSDGAIGRQVANADDPVRRPALGPDDTIYVNGATRLEALNADLRVRWTWPQAVEGHPVVGADGIIYALTKRPDEHRQLIALYPDGRLRWSTVLTMVSNTYVGVDGPVIGTDGTIYVSLRDTTRWHQKLRKKGRATPLYLI